jgi:hypothetical protein
MILQEPSDHVGNALADFTENRGRNCVMDFMPSYAAVFAGATVIAVLEAVRRVV